MYIVLQTLRRAVALSGSLCSVCRPRHRPCLGVRAMATTSSATDTVHSRRPATSCRSRSSHTASSRRSSIHSATIVRRLTCQTAVPLFIHLFSVCIYVWKFRTVVYAAQKWSSILSPSNVRVTRHIRAPALQILAIRKIDHTVQISLIYTFLIQLLSYDSVYHMETAEYRAARYRIFPKYFRLRLLPYTNGTEPLYTQPQWQFN